jgi:hypothetical protein
MKKLALLAAVLLGTAAASQAGINIHIGIPLPPLPPLPGVIFGHPAPVVVAPRPCPPPVVVVPPCGPVYGYGYGHRVHRPYRYDHGHDYRDHGRWYGGHR